MSKNYYNQIIHILQELHKGFPTYNMGRHLSTALDEYGCNIWGMTDKEMEYVLYKYKSQLEMDVPHTDDDTERLYRINCLHLVYLAKALLPQ